MVVPAAPALGDRLPVLAVRTLEDAAEDNVAEMHACTDHACAREQVDGLLSGLKGGGRVGFKAGVEPGMGDLHRAVHDVPEAQQSFAQGFDQVRHVSQGVAGCRESCDPGKDLGAAACWRPTRCTAEAVGLQFLLRCHQGRAAKQMSGSSVPIEPPCVVIGADG